MADDIKIRVGVQNNVKAGMDGVVSDVKRGTDRMEKLARGKGFMEAFSKAFRGDISGAMDELSERMGKGMNGIIGKAVVWGSGIATALFAGFKAGQQLDKAFGLSDKLGGALAKRFGVQEDEGLKAELEGLRAARKEREAAAQAEIDLKKRVVSENIKSLEKENQAIAEQGDKATEQALQRAIDQQRWQEQAKAGGKKQGIVGRIMGRADLDMQGVADRDMKAALDDDFRKQEKNAEKQVARAEERKARLLASGEKQGLKRFRARGATEQMNIGGKDWEVVKEKADPRLRRLQLADIKAQLAAQNQQNLEGIQLLAAKATIEAQKNALETAANTRQIKKLQEQLLTLK